MAKLNNNYVAVLDIGTSKVVCFIAKITSSGNLTITGIGHQLSQGIKSGIITDIKLAEQSIRSAVGAAEHMAGVTLEKIIVNISGNKQKSQLIKAEISIKGAQISSKEVSRLINQACERYKQENREIIHCIPIDYSIDGTSGIKNPQGMYGNNLSSNMHIITTTPSNILNFTNCLALCHLNIEGYVSSAYASGISCLSDEDKELGATVIDFGSGDTSLAVFKNGSIVHSDTIPVGGMHITNDIAIGLSTNIETAERIKALHGNLFKTSKDDQEIIDIPQAGVNGMTEISHIQKSTIINIIKPRVDEILDMLESRLHDFGLHNIGGHIILTGGSSQLGGLCEMVTQRFKRQARVGVPILIEGMAESTKGPSFATCTGMLMLARQQRFNKQFANKKPANSNNMVARTVKWLKENF
ncbi:MAG: cell division protein FtsA [Rickettsiaceae bacterium]|jgi:cell division protein FtsA|nr:cell division protein FtsA [Rickettsiaceae bacterium]